MRPRPADECPYPRPLPPGFRACATFHPVTYLPLDTQNRPLRPVLSCRHMEVAASPDLASARYCRCLIGDAAARAAAAARIGPERGRLLQMIADDVNGLVLAHAERLMAAKVAEAGAHQPGAWESARVRVRAASEELGTAIDARLRDRAQVLMALGVDRPALMAVIEAGLRDYERNGFAGWRPPKNLLAPLPPDVAAFLAPPDASEPTS